MKPVTSWGVLSIACLLVGALALPLSSQDSLNLSDAAAVPTGGLAEVELTLDNTSEVQGITALFEWSGGGTGESIEAGAAIANADTVVSRIEDGFGVLGVVMDDDGVDEEVILPGSGNSIATIGIRCGITPGTTSVGFADNKYATMDGGPLLDNIIVVGGFSVNASDGLGLNGGSFTSTAGADALSIGEGSANLGSVASVPIEITNSSEVQGLVAVAEWDDTNGTGETLDTSSDVLANADTVVTRIESGFAVLGVVMDSDGVDNEIILPGDDQLVATIGIRCGSTAGSTDINFVDGKYGSVEGGPLLDNIIVVGGLSVSPAEGLTLNNGSFECQAAPSKLFVGEGAASGDEGTGSAEVNMRNVEAVEGFVVALCHDSAALTLDSIDLGAAASGAEFSAVDVLADGGTIGVVLDFNSPFDGQTIAPGDANNIADYNYTCNNPPGATESATSTSLSFCDTTLGDPLKDNVIVVGGLSIGAAEGLTLEGGTFTCNPVGEPPVLAEDCNNGVDDDDDGLADGDDPDCQQAFKCEDSQGSIGTEIQVDLFLFSFPDHVQGFSMALSHCCELTAVEELDTSNTIVEAIGTEFVSVREDSDGDDGDGCETIIGVLVDALPPFDGATLPALGEFQKIGTLTYNVTDDEDACGTVCPLEFVDGLNGPGKVPVKNLISVHNESKGVQVFNCELKLVAPERFHRGDCNTSYMGSMSVDISDAAAVVSFLFLSGDWKFNPTCLDACDCNDDGRIDLADAICVLQFYLQNGAFPPAPGPGLSENDDGSVDLDVGPDVDPTADKLDCAAGTDCL